MNYDNNPELLDRLAAEYVLGTLEGAARRRFERLLADSAAAQAAVNRWQQHFSGLAQSLPEIEPPAEAWHAITARIDPPATPGRSSYLLRAWATLASLAALVLAVYVGLPSTPVATDQQVAFINEANATPLWLVSVDMDSGELVTRALSAEAAALDKVYELWMLPEQGNPRSLGLMPVNGNVRRQSFSPALLELLQRAHGLAVSIEPAGGSPTGVPTGPVVYQAELVNL